MKNSLYFNLLIQELTYLVDNGAFVSKKIIKNIIDDGYDTVDYLNRTLNYKMNWSFFNKYNRKLTMEVIAQYYENYGDKYSKVENNGLLFLIDLCVIIIEIKYYENIDMSVRSFWGNLTDKQICKLKDGKIIVNSEKYLNR